MDPVRDIAVVLGEFVILLVRIGGVGLCVSGSNAVFTGVVGGPVEPTLLLEGEPVGVQTANYLRAYAAL